MTHVCKFIFVGTGVPFAVSDLDRFKRLKIQEAHRWSDRDEMVHRSVRDSMTRPCDSDCVGENHVMYCPGCQSVKKVRQPNYGRPTVVKI